MANQSPCVVPSNAPALSESSSKALRIGSGNIGSEGNKVVAVVPKSNSRTSRVHPAAFSGSLNDPIEVDLRVREKKRRRQTRNYFTDRNGMRIHSSKVRDPVLTLCELQSPRYLAYRAKQRQQKDNKVEQKWTDELEEVFQQGQSSSSKPRGLI